MASRYNVVHCNNYAYVEETNKNGSNTHVVHQGPRGGLYFNGDDGDKRYIKSMATHTYPAECNTWNNSSSSNGCSSCYSDTLFPGTSNDRLFTD